MTQHRYNPSTRCKMGEVGQWIGTYDRKGREICIGDTVRFDPTEWGSDDCEFVVQWEDGELILKGSFSELTDYCEVIRRAT